MIERVELDVIINYLEKQIKIHRQLNEEIAGDSDYHKGAMEEDKRLLEKFNTLKSLF